MALSLHNLEGSRRKRSRRVGRGNASGRGTYSGRGQKGQRARSGGKKGLQQRALRQLFQRLPKLGGFRSLKPKAAVVTLTDLQKHFAAGTIVNQRILVNKGLIKSGRPVKILDTGTIDRSLRIQKCRVSAGARKKIVAAGGTIE
ncbi:MAG: 50S ribosomal protein L15 [Parcubacteria group bacterium GW2011_GWA2_46_9]|nr:MAG: 50S ribosomal protein L15 [Parcubacteria group bacterium GW2011_GWA2_46_9]